MIVRTKYMSTLVQFPKIPDTQTSNILALSDWLVDGND